MKTISGPNILMNCKRIIKKKKGGGGEREEADLGQFSNSVKLGEVGRKLA